MNKAVSKDGTRIAFKESGVGHPLLLVHGTTADHTRWDKITPRLAERFTVYAMDRRGRGESGDGPDYHILREAEDVAAVVEAIAEPTYLIGHSYGALCSLEASKLTKKIKKLILYEPPIPTNQHIVSQAIIQEIQTLVDQGKNEAALETMMQKVVKMPAHELAYYRTLPVWKTRITIAPTIPRELNTDWVHQFDTKPLADIYVPTMFLMGGDSPQFFHEAIKPAETALPNSQVEIMPGEQHIAMDTNPDLFIQKVFGFLMNEE